MRQKRMLQWILIGLAITPPHCEHTCRSSLVYRRAVPCLTLPCSALPCMVCQCNTSWWLSLSPFVRVPNQSYHPLLASSADKIIVTWWQYGVFFFYPLLITDLLFVYWLLLVMARYANIYDMIFFLFMYSIFTEVVHIFQVGSSNN
jgi:hypothetical protein